MTIEKTQHDWQYYTEKHDKYCRSFKNGCYWPRGKMLGGSHSINALIYFRGNREDFDNWERLGNPSWDYDSVLEYFKKTENNLNHTLVNEVNKKWHSNEGAMPVGHYSDSDNIRHVFIQAAKEYGYDLVDDLNGEVSLGYTYLQGTLKNGQRFTTAKSLLVPAKDRKNLHIIKHAHVTKVIVDAHNTVTGVEFTYKNEHKLNAKATKEVILSSGAVNSPQLLMLSGIGPKKHLEQFGIPVVKDLPVGKNLQDHVIAPILFQFHKSTAKAESVTDQLDDLYQYIMHRSGPLAGIGSINLAGLINSENHTGYPDIEMQCFDFRKGSINLEKNLRTLGYSENVIEAFVGANAEGEVNNVYVELLRPESTGEILLKSKNPFEAPRIIPNYFENEEDAKTLVRGIQFITGFVESKSFKEHEGELVRIVFDDCDQFEYRSYDYWKCYLSHMATTVYHPVGTCKMGPDTDKEAVVDSELRVRGIIMIAEKGADFIKSTWQKTTDKTEL